MNESGYFCIFVTNSYDINLKYKLDEIIELKRIIAKLIFREYYPL